MIDHGFHGGKLGVLKVPVTLEDAERALHFAYQEQKEGKEGNKGAFHTSGSIMHANPNFQLVTIVNPQPNLKIFVLTLAVSLPLGAAHAFILEHMVDILERQDILFSVGGAAGVKAISAMH